LKVNFPINGLLGFSSSILPHLIQIQWAFITRLALFGIIKLPSIKIDLAVISVVSAFIIQFEGILISLSDVGTPETSLEYLSNSGV